MSCARCGTCCGPVLCSREEWEAIALYAWERGIIPEVGLDPLSCPFLGDGLCRVYEVRPKVCRLFGHLARLRCPIGSPCNVEMGPEAEARAMAGYEPTVLLHEACGIELPAPARALALGVLQSRRNSPSNPGT